MFRGTGLLFIKGRNDDAQVLLARRDGPPFDGKWTVPSISYEKGKTPWPMAVQAAKESVGLPPKAEFTQDVLDTPGERQRLVTRIPLIYRFDVFLAPVEEYPESWPESHEGYSEAEWFGLDELPEDTVWGMKRLFKQARKFIRERPDR